MRLHPQRAQSWVSENRRVTQSHWRYQAADYKDKSQANYCMIMMMWCKGIVSITNEGSRGRSYTQYHSLAFCTTWWCTCDEWRRSDIRDRLHTLQTLFSESKLYPENHHSFQVAWHDLQSSILILVLSWVIWYVCPCYQRMDLNSAWSSFE